MLLRSSRLLYQILEFQALTSQASLPFWKAPTKTHANSHSPRSIAYCLTLSKRPCMPFRALLRCFSRKRSSVLDSTQQPRDSQQLPGPTSSNNAGSSAAPPPAGSSTASQAQPHDQQEQRTYSMAKRKSEASAESTDVPAKKTKAAPKRSKKSDAEGECHNFSLQHLLYI